MPSIKKRIPKALRAVVIMIIIILFFFGAAFAKTKFYNFEDQLINGDIRKPSNLYFDARQRVQFEQLLRLKKNFMNDLFETAKDRIFK
jgi:uncharacterized membrane protein YvbJ|tara:strand:- start:258 stop:521 length:264 start_codon:yes stop_codon:yes gene_type:complete